MSSHLLDPRARTPQPGPPHRRHRPAVVVAVVVVLLAFAGLVVTPHLNEAPPPPASRTMVATAVSGASSQDLLAVEGRLVGPTAVVDPSSGRLPDAAAFAKVGLQSARIDGGQLTLTFLPHATTAQVEHARVALLASPEIAQISDNLDLMPLQKTLTAAVADPQGPPGLIVAASTPQGMWAGSAGVADLASGTPISPAMQYRIGSTTKTLTAVVVLQLVNEGRVALDQPVSTYLPGLLPYPQPITVRDLLAHTSGLVDSDHFGAKNLVPARDVPRIADPALRQQAENALREGQTNPALVVPLRVYMAVVTTRPLAFAPGSAYTYSNSDYVVLSMLVEKVTGHSLADEYAARLFGPLRMTHTFLASTPDFPAAYTHSYTQDTAGKRVDATADLALGTEGSGLVVSTPADMTVFFRALLQGRLLPPDLLGQMKSPTWQSIAAGDSYSLGLAHYRTPCGQSAIGHGGAIGGYLTDVYASDDGSEVVVYVQNSSGTDHLGALRQTLAARAFCDALPPRPSVSGGSR